MKNLRNAILIGLTIFSFNSSAQISLGVGGGMLKSTEDNSEAVFGGEIYFKYEVTDAIRAGVNLGFYQTSEELFGVKVKSSLAPISVLGEYLFLDGDFRPYVGLHVGILRAASKVGSNGNSNSYFSLAPVLGAEYAINDQLGVNFNFKYGVAFYKNDFTDEVENFSSFSPNIGVFYKL
jgi:outer membrane protein W